MMGPKFIAVSRVAAKWLALLFLPVTPLITSETVIAQQLCVDIGDPAGNFVPRGYCIPSNPGDIGAEVSVQLENVTLNVLEDPDGRFDVIVPLQNSITANSSRPIDYVTSLMWPSSPVSRESVRVRELGVNFRPDPTSPAFAPLTNVLAGAAPPNSFSWVPDPSDATKVIGWTVQQQFDAVPLEIGGSISHYHMTTWGLPVGTQATFSKSVAGGIVVVPEPSALGLGLLGIGAISLIEARRRRYFRFPH